MTIFFDSIIILKSGEKTVGTEKIYEAKTTRLSIWDVNVDNIVISKLVERKTNSKYLIRYLDQVIRLLYLILAKMIGYVKKLKVKDKNIKLMPFCIDDEKLLEKYKIFGLKLKT